MDVNNPLYFFVLFVAMWIGIGFFVGQISGWGQLSRFYRTNNSFSGQIWRLKSGSMRYGMRLNNCLKIGVSPQGPYLAVLFLFRVGSPPLLIPWQDVSVETGKTLWWKWIEFHFRQAPGVHLKIFGRLGESIRSAAGQSWPAQNLPPQHRF